LLLDRWEQVREGLGQTVLICGEAGVGKSRLVQILRQRLTTTPHTWLECRCSPYAENSAFYPIIELMQQVFGFTAGDEADGWSVASRVRVSPCRTVFRFSAFFCRCRRPQDMRCRR
jgi:predicted ATPase